MVDLYLQAMMRGEFSKKSKSKAVSANKFNKSTLNSPLDVAIENELEKHLEKQIFIDIEENVFNSPEMKKERLKAELLEALQMNEYTEHLLFTFRSINSEGRKYLDRESYELLITEIYEAQDALIEFDTSSGLTQDIHELLHISDESLMAISKIALNKFEEISYNECLAYFMTLALLSSSNPDFWLRAGIAAQYLKDYDLAIRNYGNATSLDPNLIPAYLFAAECFYHKNMKDEAFHQRDIAREKMNGLPSEASWDELIENINTIIN